MPKPFDREAVREAMRLAVLDALDKTARYYFRHGDDLQPGADDSDLPELFRVIDAQTERLFNRYEVL